VKTASVALVVSSTLRPRRHASSATGIEVPAEVVEALAAGRRPPVRVTLAAHTYRTTVASRGGRFLVHVADGDALIEGEEDALGVERGAVGVELEARR